MTGQEREALRWSSEPCGRCGHDVNDHLIDQENDIANECEHLNCTCDGFITETARTRTKYGAHNV